MDDAARRVHPRHATDFVLKGGPRGRLAHDIRPSRLGPAEPAGPPGGPLRNAAWKPLLRVTSRSSRWKESLPNRSAAGVQSTGEKAAQKPLLDAAPPDQVSNGSSSERAQRHHRKDASDRPPEPGSATLNRLARRRPLNTRTADSSAFPTARQPVQTGRVCPIPVRQDPEEKALRRPTPGAVRATMSVEPVRLPGQPRHRLVRWHRRLAAMTTGLDTALLREARRWLEALWPPAPGARRGEAAAGPSRCSLGTAIVAQGATGGARANAGPSLPLRASHSVHHRPRFGTPCSHSAALSSSRDGCDRRIWPITEHSANAGRAHSDAAIQPATDGLRPRRFRSGGGLIA